MPTRFLAPLDCLKLPAQDKDFEQRALYYAATNFTKLNFLLILTGTENFFAI
jgi:hypothetical protein